MVTIGVCDKDLSELIACHQIHYLLNSSGIEFVEDIVEQE
jgi:hypothetical protein